MTNFFQKPAFPWILTLLLIGLNAVLLVFLWTGDKRKHHNPPHHGPKRVEMILGFDDAQKASFQGLLDGHIERRDSLHARMMKHRQSAFGQLKGGNPDSSIVANELRELGNATVDMEMEIFDHFLNVRNICKPEQLSKFDQDLIQEMFRPKHRGPKGQPPHR